MTDQPAEPSLTLAQLYALDPLTLTRDGPEVVQIVASLRSQRASFNETESRGERPKTPRKPKEKVDLTQLAIDI